MANLRHEEDTTKTVSVVCVPSAPMVPDLPSADELAAFRLIAETAENHWFQNHRSEHNLFVQGIFKVDDTRGLLGTLSLSSPTRRLFLQVPMALSQDEPPGWKDLRDQVRRSLRSTDISWEPDDRLVRLYSVNTIAPSTRARVTAIKGLFRRVYSIILNRDFQCVLHRARAHMFWADLPSIELFAWQIPHEGAVHE